jgi:DNA-binding NtrC family response regulator
MVGVREDRPKNVLVVEDEKAIRVAMRRALQEHCRVLLSEGPEEALALMRAEPVDIVLVDFLMPGGTGEEFLREVSRGWPHVRRALVSGTPPDHLDDLIHEGLIEEFVPKPWTVDELIQLVRKLSVAR